MNEQKDKRAEYLNTLFTLFKKKEKMGFSLDKTYFNDTERRLIGEVLSAGYEGKRLISTRLATILGVTRSAVSQIVNKLEAQGIVKRVPDEVDRKIAYIEVTQAALERYAEDLHLCLNFIGEVVDVFGEKKFKTMCSLVDEFTQLIEREKLKFIKASAGV